MTAVFVGVLITVLLMLQVERIMARRQNRRSEPGTVIMCAVVGIGYFVAMLATTGHL